ncbi:MAG: shikimate dehydrogenase [Candidatus Hydrogenedentota bacterium]|nr:MAG: shikimate dehydrogenase [Candidatus Hydrogenedentota bacterium]
MKIDAKTRKFGIIGYPLGHSLSPAMHNAAFEALNMNAVYLPFPVKNLVGLKHSLRQLGVEGVSVTIPYKVRVRRIVDTLDPLAIQIGSINTMVFDPKGLLRGYNTDGIGAVRALNNHGFNITGKKILILGSGGSARAIAFSLLQEKPKMLAIASRNEKTAKSILRSLSVVKKKPDLRFYHFHSKKKKYARKQVFTHIQKEIFVGKEQLQEFDLIIHTTPLGMKGHSEGQCLLQEEDIFSHQLVFDIVYNPLQTPLLKLAKKRKADVLTGEKMLLYQGVAQFELFTGEKAPVTIMEKALQVELKK